MSFFESLGKKAKRLMEKAEEGTGIDLQGVQEKAKDLSHKATKKINAYTRTALRQDENSSGSKEPDPQDSQTRSDATDGAESLDFAALKAKAIQWIANAKTQTDEAKKDVARKTQTAAEMFAEAISSKTGKQVSTDQVKKVAMIAGITLLATDAIDLVGDAMGEGISGEELSSETENPVEPSFEGVSESGTEAQSNMNSGSRDVVADAGKVIAENGGSLNIEPIVIDQDGCQL